MEINTDSISGKSDTFLNIWTIMWENVPLDRCANEHVDQHAHPHSLIRAVESSNHYLDNFFTILP